MENKSVSGDFSITIMSGQPTVVRNFRFANGSTVDFSVTLPKDDTANIPDLHRKSISAVIELLQGLVTPK